MRDIERDKERLEEFAAAERTEENAEWLEDALREYIAEAKQLRERMFRAELSGGWTCPDPAAHKYKCHGCQRMLEYGERCICRD